MGWDERDGRGRSNGLLAIVVRAFAQTRAAGNLAAGRFFEAKLEFGKFVLATQSTNSARSGHRYSTIATPNPYDCDSSWLLGVVVDTMRLRSLHSEMESL